MSEQVRKDELKGSYEVWHDNDWPASKFRHICGEDDLPTTFPEGFTRVAVVEARSLDQVVAMMNHVGNSQEPSVGDRLQDGRRNEGVEAHALGRRVTTFGDVIVDPQGKAHRVECTGIEPISSSERQAASHDRHLEGIADYMPGRSKEIEWEPER